MRSVNGVATYFIFDGEDIIAEVDSSNNVKALYLHGPGIDDPIAMTRDLDENGSFDASEFFIYTKDHLGSIRELTNLSQKPIQRYNYSSYGRTTIEKTNVDSETFVSNFYAYTGREWEKESGDYYYRARYYDPRTGRFLSQDPIGFLSGDSNLYRYVFNNALKYKDPSGFKLGYACEKSRLGLEDYVNKLRISKKGGSLIQLLEESPHTYLIKLDLQGTNSYNPATRTITINPNQNLKIVTNEGNSSLSTLRILAHELGHAAGEKDDGPGDMNNVNKWENPIMTPIDGLIRLEY